MNLNKVKLTRDAVQKLYRIHGSKEIHYNTIKDTALEFTINIALSTSCKFVGLMESTRRGFTKFKRAPIETDYVKIYEHSLSMSRAGYIRKKEKIRKLTEQNTPPHLPVETSANVKPITDEYCIEFLKKKGYRILKPIQPQYEEL